MDRRPAVAADDQDAAEALGWLQSGMPDSKIAYGPDAPRLDPKQLSEFKPASYERDPIAGQGSRRAKNTAK